MLSLLPSVALLETMLFTYVVDKNTKVYSLNGKDLTAINKGDKVSVLAGDVEDGVAILKTLVYTD